MPAPTPLISVIVVCKNPGPRLAIALDSVWAQRPLAPEIIVVDGLSSDGSREWLETHRARLSTLVSEDDEGVYDAMNKGVAVAKGEWILFLGADDQLTEASILDKVAAHLQSTGADVAVGEIAYNDGRVYRLHSPLRPLARNFIHHQAAFYRRVLFADAGVFDPSLKVMGDYELNLRLWKRQVRFECLPLRIATCSSKGLSDRGQLRGYREEILVRHRYASAWRCWGWDTVSLLRWFRKKLLRSLSFRHV